MGLAIKPHALIKFLEANGWSFIRARGTSHHIYGKDGQTVPIPIHKDKDMPIGTLLSVLVLTKTTKKELEEWLGR